MRVVFGVLSLVLGLVIVGSLAKTQLQALSGPAAARPDAAVTASTVTGAAEPAPAGAQGTAQQIGHAAARALQQGAQRNADAPQ